MNPFQTTEIHIKNMVCDRCISVVREGIESLGIDVLEINLGKVIVKFIEVDSMMDKIEKILNAHDFELLTDADNRIVERIKVALIEIVNQLPDHVTLSQVLSKKLSKDYSSLSKLFSNKERVTIEKYYIKLKIEKVKELIQDSEFNLSQIAYDLGYSSVNYLSTQFKSEVGMSMSEYKKMSLSGRKPIDKIL